MARRHLHGAMAHLLRSAAMAAGHARLGLAAFRSLAGLAVMMDQATVESERELAPALRFGTACGLEQLPRRELGSSLWHDPRPRTEQPRKVYTNQPAVPTG